MIKQLIRKAVLASLVVPPLVISFSGCKLKIVVPEGGRVVTESGAYPCDSGRSCSIEVVDIYFSEIFRAEAAAGYYFRHWQGGDHRLCGDTFGSCYLSTAGFEGNAALEAVLESDEVFRLRPLFAPGTCEPWREFTTDVFYNEFLEEGMHCTDEGKTRPVRQGVFRAYQNDQLVSVTRWDQGRMHGRSTYYYDDGKALREVVGYRHGKYHGTQKKYDARGRLVLVARWFGGELQGESITYDYSRAAEYGGNPIVLSSSFDAGKLDGLSRVDYPDGAWETRQWADGVQFGEYQVFVPHFGQRVAGWRTVYVFVDGLIRYGYGYFREAVPGTGDYREEGGPDGPWIWPCVYVNGELDQEDCFRDGLTPLGPRI